MKRKWMCGLLAVLMLFACCAVGCNKKPPVAGDEYEVNLDLDPNISATLKVTSYENELELFESLMDGFNQFYPYVELEFDPLAGELYSTMMGYYGGDQMPDIMINQSFDMLALDGAGMLLNLDPYIRAEAASGEEDAFDTSDYWDYFWKLGQRDFNGSQIMIPRSSDQVVVHYNKEVLKAAGVDLNPATTKVKNGWTWEDFLSVCAQVKAYFNESGTTRPIMDAYITWEANFNAILSSFGVEYFRDGASAIDSQNTRDALELIRELRTSGYIAKTTSSIGANFDGGQGAFMIHSRAIGETVEALQGGRYGSVALEDMHNVYDVVSFPLIGDTPKIGAGVAGYSIASTSQNRDVAWQFMKFMLSKEGQNILADFGLTSPPMRKDMVDITDESNHWVKGYDKFNLNAYLYGREENYIQATEYILERPARANDLKNTVSELVESYINTDAKDEQLSRMLDELIDKCAGDLEYWAYN